MLDLAKIFENGELDYNEIKNNNVVIIQDSEACADINFIVTARNRREFAEPMFRSFCDARNESMLNIQYTVVEHSSNPDHSRFCKKVGANYIWIKCGENDLFNKCLAYNMGALYSNISKYIIFHDIDCVIQSDYFYNIEKNILNKKCRAMQCFQQRRVLYCDQELTSKIISSDVDVNQLELGFMGVDLPRLGGKVMLGAPGGSILVERDLLFEVGGFNPVFEGNSPEDAFFWKSIETVDKMCVCDDPPIDIFHLYHPPTYLIPQQNRSYLEEINKTFDVLSKEERIKIIKRASDRLKKFRQ